MIKHQNSALLKRLTQLEELSKTCISNSKYLVRTEHCLGRSVKGTPKKCLFFVKKKHLTLMYGYVRHSPNAPLLLKKIKKIRAGGVAQAPTSPPCSSPPTGQLCVAFLLNLALGSAFPREKWSSLIRGSVAWLGSSLGYSGFSFRASFSRQEPRATVDQEVPQNQVGTKSAGVKLDNNGPYTL